MNLKCHNWYNDGRSILYASWVQRCQARLCRLLPRAVASKCTLHARMLGKCYMLVEIKGFPSEDYEKGRVRLPSDYPTLAQLSNIFSIRFEWISCGSLCKCNVCRRQAYIGNNDKLNAVQLDAHQPCSNWWLVTWGNGTRPYRKSNPQKRSLPGNCPSQGDQEHCKDH